MDGIQEKKTLSHAEIEWANKHRNVGRNFKHSYTKKKLHLNGHFGMDSVYMKNVLSAMGALYFLIVKRPQESTRDWYWQPLRALIPR